MINILLKIAKSSGIFDSCHGAGSTAVGAEVFFFGMRRLGRTRLEGGFFGHCKALCGMKNAGCEE